MRHILSIALFCLVCSSCYRADKTHLNTGIPVFKIYTNNSYPYYGGGSIADSIVTFKVRDSNSLNISLTFSLLSGNPENYWINASITGLPNGIVCAKSADTFMLNYKANFYLNVTADTGIYTIYINISADNLAKTYPVKIRVLPPEDDAPSLAGTYSGSDPCGHFSIGSVWYTYMTTVSTVPGYPHWVAIKNFRGLGDSIVVYGFVYTGSGKIDLPVQTIGGYTIFGRGKGYYSNDTHPSIHIYGDTIVHGNDTQTCYTQLKWK